MKEIIEKIKANNKANNILTHQLIDEVITRLKASNRGLEFAAFNYDNSKIEDLQPGIVEDTGVGTSCLIEVRNNNYIINQLYYFQETLNM